MSQKNIPPPFSTRQHGVTYLKTELFIHKHVLQIYLKNYTHNHDSSTPVGRLVSFRTPIMLDADINVARFWDEDSSKLGHTFVTLVGLGPNSLLWPWYNWSLLTVEQTQHEKFPVRWGHICYDTVEPRTDGSHHTPRNANARSDYRRKDTVGRNPFTPKPFL